MLTKTQKHLFPLFSFVSGLKSLSFFFFKVHCFARRRATTAHTCVSVKWHLLCPTVIYNAAPSSCFSICPPSPARLQEVGGENKRETVMESEEWGVKRVWQLRNSSLWSRVPLSQGAAEGWGKCRVGGERTDHSFMYSSCVFPSSKPTHWAAAS